MSLEEFAADIRTAPVTGGNDVDLAGPLAQHLANLGYRKMQMVSTAEEIDALPNGSLILDSDPDVLIKRMGRWRSPDHPDHSFGPASVGLPVTVLHVGTDE